MRALFIKIYRPNVLFAVSVLMLLKPMYILSSIAFLSTAKQEALVFICFEN